MSENLPVHFKWIESTSHFNKDIMKIEDCDERYFLEVDVQYPEKLHDLHIDLPFLPKKMKIEKVEKLAANLHDKKEYVTDIHWHEHRAKKKCKKRFEKGFLEVAE